LDGGVFQVKLLTMYLPVAGSKPAVLPQVADAEFQVLVDASLNYQMENYQKMGRRERLKEISGLQDEP